MSGEQSRVIKRIRERERERLVRRDAELDSLFERLYFHEIDGRDKVIQRLQLPLVAFLAISGFVGSMLQNVRRDDQTLAAVFFWLPLLVGIVALAAALMFFVASLVGKKYKYLPLPVQWQEHRATCVKHYEGYNNQDELVSAALQQHLVQRYAECATWNGDVNAKKMYYNFALLRCLVIAVISTLLAFIALYAGRLDKGAEKRSERVRIEQTVEVKKAETISSTTMKGKANVKPEAAAAAAAAASTGDPRGQAASLHSPAATATRPQPSAIKGN